MTTIATVGVLGGGLMGSGIAQVAAQNGFATIVRLIASRTSFPVEILMNRSSAVSLLSVTPEFATQTENVDSRGG